MKNVIAAIDFSEFTSAVVEQATSLAMAYDAQLTIIHVAAPDPAFVGMDAGPQTVRDARAEELREEHRQLLSMAEVASAKGLEVKQRLVEGPTVETILREAQFAAESVIVIGSHGHGSLYNILVGSVSSGVIKEARCPVLVVPHKSVAASSGDA